jgi:hypothetical protein
LLEKEIELRKTVESELGLEEKNDGKMSGNEHESRKLVVLE